MMSLTAEESQLFKQALSAMQKNLGDVGAARSTVRQNPGVTTELVGQLNRIGLAEVFSVTRETTATEIARKFRDASGQLSRNRTGRLSAAAGELDRLLTEMSRTPQLDPSTPQFWTAYFDILDRRRAGALDAFAAELAAANSIVRMILASDLVRRMEANELGGVPVGEVVRRLGYRGIVVIPDLSKHTYDAVRSAGTGVLRVLRPAGTSADAECTFESPRPGAWSLAELTTQDIERAVRWCDERGAEKLAVKNALAGIRSGLPDGGSPDGRGAVGVAVTAYFLQLIDEQRRAGILPAAIRASLRAVGLEERSVGRLLNEQTASHRNYIWG